MGRESNDALEGLFRALQEITGERLDHMGYWPSATAPRDAYLTFWRDDHNVEQVKYFRKGGTRCTLVLTSLADLTPEIVRELRAAILMQHLKGTR